MLTGSLKIFRRVLLECPGLNVVSKKRGFRTNSNAQNDGTPRWQDISGSFFLSEQGNRTLWNKIPWLGVQRYGIKSNKKIANLP